MADGQRPQQPAVDRRSFLRRAAGVAVTGGGAAGMVYAFVYARRHAERPHGAREHRGIIRPPGALEEAAFLARCVRCTKCADSCVTQCIRYFGPEAGTLAGTPYVLPRVRACSLCMECCATCPTGALEPLEKKEDVKMGLAVVDKRLCVSHNGTGVCGSCHTMCPLKNRAITQGLRLAPDVHEDHCTGCGMCEEICIVRTRRAIEVRTDRLWPGVKRERSRDYDV